MVVMAILLAYVVVHGWCVWVAHMVSGGVCAWVLCVGAVHGCCAWVGQVNAVDSLGGMSCISDSVAPTY